MIALARFQVAGFLRSYRFLPALLAVLPLMVFLGQPPSGRDARVLAGGTFGDAAALMFPVWALITKVFLDTEPDGQRELSALAAPGRVHPTLAGLAGAYAMNLLAGGVVLAAPLAAGMAFAVGPAAMLAGVAVNVLAAAAATVTGAFTCRALVPSPAISALCLVGGPLAVLLVSMSPLGALSVPMIGWLRAAHRSPEALVTALPGLALHLTLWCAVAGCAYTILRLRLRTRS